jgi:hypothetical protein
VAAVPTQVVVALGAGSSLIERNEAVEYGCGESKHAAGTKPPHAFAQHRLPVVPRHVLDDVFAEDEVERLIVEGKRFRDSEANAGGSLPTQVRGEPAVDMPLAGSELQAPDRVGFQIGSYPCCAD